MRTKRNQQLRQRNMIFEVMQTYFIKEVNEAYTVCNVILPNADQLDRKLGGFPLYITIYCDVIVSRYIVMLLHHDIL